MGFPSHSASAAAAPRDRLVGIFSTVQQRDSVTRPVRSQLPPLTPHPSGIRYTQNRWRAGHPQRIYDGVPGFRTPSTVTSSIPGMVSG